MTMTELLKEYTTRKMTQQTQQLNIDGLIVNVRITDLRQCWNRLDALVTPVSGTGEVWVEARRLKQPS